MANLAANLSTYVKANLTRSIWSLGSSLVLCTAMTAAVVTQGPADGGSSLHPHTPGGMVYVADARYQPLYADPSDRDAEARPVEPFFLDRYAVTNGEFLAFVEENASWRRSEVKRMFADEGYLRYWEGDLDIGGANMANRPVVNVSWFAARAYAEWKGRRLPTTAEWEAAAAVGLETSDGVEDAEYRKRRLEWYSIPASAGLPAVESSMCNDLGACGLHGLVWEWVDDFNSSLVTGESRNNGDMDLGLFCGNGAVGASDFTDYTAFLRFGYRSGLQARFTVSALGFRTAANASLAEKNPSDV